MSMTDQQEQLILKLLNGTILPNERETLNSWINASEDNKKLIEDFTVMWKLSKDNLRDSDFQTQEEWTKLESSIHNVKPYGKEVRLNPHTWLRAAASIAFLILFSWMLYLFVFNNETIVKESQDSVVKVALPDGSEVLLNHRSRLTYQEDFNKKDRIVNLVGEAFFEVKKDAHKPFIIQTDQAQIKVLGTSFNVQADPSTNATEVFVATGLVSFSSIQNNSDAITLKPGETGTLQKNNKIIVFTKEENLNALAWKEKRLVFKKTALSRVVENLEEYFNIDIDIKNKNVLRCRFTGSFSKPTLEEIIEALSVSLNLHITMHENHYVVDGDGC